jgi:hypothetical protein
MQQHVPKQDSEEAKEHLDIDEEIRLIKLRKKRRKRLAIGISLAILLILSSWIVYSLVSPGKYDNFAKCLTGKGAVMYGEDWCQYTQGQKTMFGKSFKYINYEQKSDLNRRPTWVIDGKSYETVQSFERLAALTGCTY